MHATSAAISTHDFGRCYIFRAIPKNMIVARTPALETFICDKSHVCSLSFCLTDGGYVRVYLKGDGRKVGWVLNFDLFYLAGVNIHRGLEGEKQIPRFGEIKN